MASRGQRAFATIDDRLGLRGAARATANKVFPSNWSFLLGEVALVSLGVLILTGVFLTLFYRPTTDPIVYQGSAEIFAGREFPGAFTSILRLSHDVPGGLLFRRLHRAASHLFIATIVLHMLRIILTGAFRKPREPNYLVGVGLLTLAFGAGFTGYSLPYDSLAGTGIRIAYTELLSLPVIGDNVAFWIFGGPFPTGDVIPRFFVAHVLLLPLVILGGVGVHLAMVARQRHTQFPRMGVDGHRLVLGKPLWPSQAAETATLTLWTTGLLALAATLIPWADVSLLGPYTPGQVGNSAQPDWFMFWLEGMLRTFPAVEFTIPPGIVISGPFVAGVVLPGAIFTFLAAYPFIEKRVYGLQGEWHVLQNPLEIPLRAGTAMAFFSLILVLSAAATNDVLSRMTGIPIEALIWFFRVAIVVIPLGLGLALAAYSRRRLRARGLTVASSESEEQQRYLAA